MCEEVHIEVVCEEVHIEVVCEEIHIEVHSLRRSLKFHVKSWSVSARFVQFVKFVFNVNKPRETEAWLFGNWYESIKN